MKTREGTFAMSTIFLGTDGDDFIAVSGSAVIFALDGDARGGGSESNGSITVVGGLGNDDFLGGEGGDTFYDNGANVFDQGGSYAQGGGGDDVIVFDSAGFHLAYVGSPDDPDLSFQAGTVVPLFDERYYREHNSDVAAEGIDPLLHFQTYGWKEGRDPGALFDTTFYLQNNPDVAVAGIDPLLHFQIYGWKEGRDPSPLFDVSDYLARNPDIAAASIDPLLHALLYGIDEGRMGNNDVFFFPSF